MEQVRAARAQLFMLNVYMCQPRPPLQLPAEKSKLLAGRAVATYIPLTFVVTEWRGKVRKQMNTLDTEKEGKATDMLLVRRKG